MSNINKEFHELLMRNNDQEMKEYIRIHGKDRKPISPIYFVLKEEPVEPLFFI